jgi:hypothetical protein
VKTRKKKKKRQPEKFENACRQRNHWGIAKAWTVSDFTPCKASVVWRFRVSACAKLKKHAIIAPNV